MNLCEICHQNEVWVHLKVSETETRHICMECHNNLVAEEMDINLIPFRHGEYEFTGVHGEKHRFYIERKVSPVGIGFEANEITADDSAGFRVEIMDEVDCDQKRLFDKLKLKIEKTISKRYLKRHPPTLMVGNGQALKKMMLPEDLNTMKNSMKFRKWLLKERNLPGRSSAG